MGYSPFGEMAGFENMIRLNVSENAGLLRTDENEEIGILHERN